MKINLDHQLLLNSSIGLEPTKQGENMRAALSYANVGQKILLDFGILF